MRTATAPSFVGFLFALTAGTAPPPAAADPTLADQIIATAKTYLGTPYKFGADMETDVPDYFDCSAFTKHVFQTHNIYLQRASYQQMTQGVAVVASKIQKGDLLFFKTVETDETTNHVGIYLGGNQIIHTYKVGVGVTISDLWGASWGDAFVGARRVIPASGIAAYVQEVNTTYSSLYVRAGPGTGYAVVGKVHKGERYVQVGLNSSGWWRKFWLNGKEAWISQSYVKTLAGAKAVRVAWSTINVRAGAGTSFPIVGIATIGQYYGWHETSANAGSTGLTAGWHRIAFNGAYAWVSGAGCVLVTP